MSNILETMDSLNKRLRKFRIVLVNYSDSINIEILRRDLVNRFRSVSICLYYLLDITPLWNNTEVSKYSLKFKLSELTYDELIYPASSISYKKLSKVLDDEDALYYFILSLVYYYLNTRETMLSNTLIYSISSNIIQEFTTNFKQIKRG